MLAVVIVGMPVGGVLLRGLSLPALADAVNRAGGSAIRTLLYGGAASFLVCLLSFFVAYGVHRRAMPGWQLAQPMTLFLFALPGAIIGIGLIALWNRPGFNPNLFQSGVAHHGFCCSICRDWNGSDPGRSLATATRARRGCRNLRRGWFQRVFRILFPLLQPSMLAAAG
jgi:ABC-type Fe3+ transport system permease subunit